MRSAKLFGEKMRLLVYILLLFFLVTGAVACALNPGRHSRALQEIQSRVMTDSETVNEKAEDGNDVTTEELEALDSLGYISGDTEVEEGSTAARETGESVDDASAEAIDAEEPGEIDQHDTGSGEPGSEDEDPEHENGIQQDISSGTSRQSSLNDELIPLGWPDYLPIIVDFNITYTGQVQSEMYVIAFGEGPVDDVREFYMNLPGWELSPLPEPLQGDQDTENEKEDELFYFVHGDEAFVFSVYTVNEKTRLNLMYSEQKPE